jgi:hypothetical protein
VTASGTLTSTDAESATVLNTFYIEKVKKLREKLQVHCHPQIVSSCPRSVPNSNNEFFAFGFADETKIAKTIRRLKPTKARGIDDIPASILKLGVSVLAAPIARLVNVSLASGVVPRAFKTAIIVPVYKGKGKPKQDPASYRPIALLPSMAKVLEIVVRDDLEAFLASTGALPDTQYGFRPARSASMALATAEAAWQAAKESGKVVGIMAFDLTAAFDTVGKEQLLPRLQALGVRGRELSWFDNYLSGGRQTVIWGDSASDLEEVMYGIRQGSCLSPLLFLALVSDMPGGTEVTGYADDTCMWSSSNNLSSLKTDLEAKAKCFADYVSSRGLVMNATKTQVIISGKRLPQDFTVTIDSTNVTPSETLDLLGVTFGRDLSTRPQQAKLAAALRQRATMISRLSYSIPRGPLLRQIACGIVMGKAQFAIANIAPPRLTELDSLHNDLHLHNAQVAVNDVARTLTGKKRTDHVRISDLLGSAGLPGINQVAVQAMATMTWAAFHSHDGPNHDRNGLGRTIFGTRYNNDATGVSPDNHMNYVNKMTTRSKTSGEVAISLRNNCFAHHAAKMWNKCPTLRAAASKSEAKSVATKLARDSPT